MSGQIFVITGPSGVGKGTLCAALLAQEPNLVLSISATSRTPRTGEQDGINYHFYSREAFEALIEHDRLESNPEQHALLEWAPYNGQYYGTPRESVQTALNANRHVILEIETQGALNVKSAFPEACLIFIAPPDFGVLEARLRYRATDSEEAILGRLAIAREEMMLQDRFDVVLINDDLEACLERLQGLIREVISRRE
jgi:guanylate kinase